MNSLFKLYKYTAGPVLITVMLLLIPLLAMQFTSEVVWTLGDFIIAGALLFSTGFVYKLMTMKDNSISYRFAWGSALLITLFLIWTNLAVGLIGSENNPANQMYFGVVAIGIIGAFIARFQSRKMAFTMLAMAIAMVAATIIALISGMQYAPASSLFEILAVNGFFVTLFFVSALLFLYADQETSLSDER